MSVELKPHTKLLKNLFHNMALKNLYHRQQEKFRLFSPNLDMQNSVVMFTFFQFRRQIPFLGTFGPKNQNCQFILKFDTWTNSNMQNSMAMFNFSVFDWNYPFWANLVQIIKIVRSS